MQKLSENYSTPSIGRGYAQEKLDKGGYTLNKTEAGDEVLIEKTSHHAKRVLKSIAIGIATFAALPLPSLFIAATKRNDIQKLFSQKTFTISNHKVTFEHSTKFSKKCADIWDGLHIGKTPLINKGACESRIFKDRDDKSVGIYKDLTPSDLTFKRTAEISLKKLLGITRPTELLPGGKAESKGFAEKIAYDLDQMLGLNIVPETDFINKPSLRGKDADSLGTLQLFVDGYEETKDIFLAPTHKPNGKEVKTFQEFIAFDYLIGNLDRHAENWMVKLTPDGRLDKIAVIDNGNSFVERNPTNKDKAILKNQYAWGKHAFAKEKLSTETRDFIRGLDEKAIGDFLDAKKAALIADHPHAEAFFSEAMKNNMMQRIAVLKKIAEDENATPQMLAQIKTQKDINAFLSNS